MSRSLIFLGLVVIFKLSEGFFINGGSPSLYLPDKDDIELLNKTTFRSAIYGNDKASFVEFYAHWCGACQRYAQHWKEIAKETKAWHNKVVRIAAINCGDATNDEICREFHVEYYPTLRLFPAQAQYDKPEHDSKLIQAGGNEVLVSQLVNFIEQHQHKPLSWPDLEPYTSKRLDTLFITNKNVKYGFLIFEKEDSSVGKRIILDFSAYLDKIVIRRVTPTSNPSLVSKFELDPRRLPVVFLLNNTDGSMKPYEKFDEKTVQKYVRISLKPAEEDDDDYDEKGDERTKFGNLIRKFLKATTLLENAELNKLNDNANAGKNLAEEKKKEEIKQFLTNVSSKLTMQDLESNLNVMLRSEITHVKLISGEKFKTLKEWLRVLSKYFPGRKPVRLYLKKLYEKLSSSQVNEITGNQWKIFTDQEDKMSFLPNKIEWIHCQGSDPKYRGYPCSLWSLFHVLTVSQVEMEKSKLQPFSSDFNVKEVFEAIRSFVEHFFGCRDCSQNFMKETDDYLRYLSKPHDAVKYLWTVHNRVNKRLKNDETSDPKNPKIQFPSREQCPKCYLPSVGNIEELADHESPWEINEVLLFLTSYYSKYNIEPIKESSLEINNNKNNNNSLNDLENNAEFKVADDDIPVGDLNNANSNLLKRDSLNLNLADKQHKPIYTEQNRSDIKLSFGLIAIAISVFGCLFIYFNYFKPKTKLKKHII